ncbi:phage tail protein [Pseudomonas sp. B6002]|uniref:phage tail assembly chaperone n=1 Tax=Pseudomonas sp. B6002 TaxID=2726978 RepID=UPI0015A1075F|nr:phage tail assembly chaperone [Pseudomonas sp. B6002]NVZ49428.1 phage tail protein [Pseudomonas sp. B6002]
MSYQLTHDPDTVLRLLDKATVPRAHRYWSEYEEWLSQGGIPLPLDGPDPQRLEREWRDVQIESVKWLRERHRDEADMALNTKLNDAQFSELLVYLQQLRDWPQAAEFPSMDKRPAAPGWIALQVK